MSNVHYGITEERIHRALVDALIKFYQEAAAPTRRDIVQRIKDETPDYSEHKYPDLDKEVGLRLNRWVDRGVLERVGELGVRRYLPGENYRKSPLAWQGEEL